jgi:hypothetical protein
MNYGGVAREIPIIPYAATDSTIVRGNLLEFSTPNVIKWGGTNPLFGVATGDFDPDASIVPVYQARGSTVFVACDTGVVPTIGQELFWSSAGLAKTTGTAGTGFGYAVMPGQNGQVEARLK